MTVVKNNSHLSGAPLISIGVSTYNRKKLLAESLRSLQAHTYKNFDIIAFYHNFFLKKLSQRKVLVIALEFSIYIYN